MRFCFIIEAQYRNEPLPIVIADQLLKWGHEVDLLEPDVTVTCLDDITQQDYDAYVLRTQSDGPGMSILDAVEAVGIPTINNSRSIRLVRDKTVTSVFARAHGVPIPLTYFVAHPHLLKQIPEENYPLVVKPTNGSSGRGIYRVDSPADLATLEIAEASHCFLLAQSYIDNTGFDIKLYVVGTEVYAVAKRSPLHPDVEVDKRLIPLTLELRELALRVGKIFGLDIYGLDVVETSHGPVVVDINDFPSFGQVPQAVTLLSAYVLQIASCAELQQAARAKRTQQHRKEMIEVTLQRPSITRAIRLLNGDPLRATEDIVREEMHPLR